MAELAAAVGKNVILMSAVVSWFIAQVLKTITSFWKKGQFSAERLVGAGGMPSSHTSLVVSLAVSVGLHQGFDSPLFAVTSVLAGIVMYDAAGVRRAAGKQAKILNRLVRDLKAQHTLPDGRLKELLGHTPVEVMAGAALGTFIAWAFWKFNA